MRILLLSQYFSPENLRINDFPPAMRERGHEVTVLTALPQYPMGRLFPNYRWRLVTRETIGGTPVIRLPQVTRGARRTWRLALTYISFAFFACLLGPWVLRRTPIDAIVVYQPSPVTIGIPAVFLRWWLKVPMVFWVHDAWPETLEATGAVTQPWALGIVERLVRWIYRHSDRLWVQSPDLAARVAEVTCRPVIVETVPFWAEELYRPMSIDRARQEAPDMPHGRTILYAGNFGSVQGLDTALKAAAQTRDLSDLVWVLLGDGSEEKHLRERAAALGLEGTVQFFGRRPVEAMPAYFAQADALLVILKRHATLSRTIPGKLQAYLACGRPIVASIDGIGRRLVEEAGAGECAAAEDVVGLVAAVRRWHAQSPKERLAMGCAARACYEQWFERTRIVDRMEQSLKQVITRAVV